MIEVREHGLYEVRNDAAPIWLCGSIQVKAIVSDKAKRDNFGRLLEWKNLSGNTFQKVLPMEDVDDYSAKKLKQHLRRTGFEISMRKNSWEKILTYLLETNVEEFAVSADTIGWLDQYYITPTWSVTNDKTPVFYVGNYQSEALKSKGSITQWQKEVGSLCLDNPMLIFSVCVALAAPLVSWLNWDSCGFHIVGHSKSGKTTAMQLAASIYSDETFWVNWRSTANGLEALASCRNDMLLCLDELHQAMPEEVDQTIYTLANGTSKIRSNQDGSLANRTRWKLLFLSTGEICLDEMLSKCQRKAKAGQLIRFLEIPLTGKYQTFDNIHGYDSAKVFADTLLQKIKQQHGTLIKPWVEYLVKTESLSSILEDRKSDLSKKWQQGKTGNQLGYATDRFALLAVAGEMAIEAGILPWNCGTALSAINQIFETWVANRGYEEDVEDRKLTMKVANAIKPWLYQIASTQQDLNENNSGYWLIENNELVWLLTKDSFKNALKVEFSRQTSEFSQFMLNKKWLMCNERPRGTFKTNISGKAERYYKIYPQRIDKALDLKINFSQFISHQ